MPDFSHEDRLGGIVAGLDEVGRGPLAGPVVAAAVIIDRTRFPVQLLTELDDSKKLSAKKRDRLAQLVLDHTQVGLGLAQVEEIDRMNILNATFLAMRRALDALPLRPQTVLVDGNRPPPLDLPAHCLVGGDGLSLSIAAASVVAKVHRDRLMTELDAQFPGYGWAKNAGYGTRQHLDGLARLGPTIHHRTSFAPVAQARLL